MSSKEKKDDPNITEFDIEIMEHKDSPWIFASEFAFSGPLPSDLFQITLFNPKVELYKERAKVTTTAEGKEKTETRYEEDGTKLFKQVVGTLTLSRSAAINLVTNLSAKLIQEGVIEGEIVEGESIGEP